MRGRVRELARDADGRRVWLVDVDLGADGAGRRMRRRVRIHGKRADADAELARLLSETSRGAFVGGRSTIAQILTSWLEEHVKISLAPKTVEDYSDTVERFLAPNLGAYYAADLRQTHLNYWWEKAGASQAARHRQHKVLTTALRWAARQGYCAHEVPLRLTPPRLPHEPMTVIEADEALAFVANAKGTALYVPALLALTAGLRRLEVCRLRWEHMDLAAGMVYVAPIKRGRPRTVPILSFALDELHGYKAESDEWRMMMGPRFTEHGFVCRQRDGSPRSPAVISSHWSKFAARHGRPGFSFHDLRHCFASICIAAGHDIIEVSGWLGHKDPAITARIYAHQFAAHRRHDIERVDAVFNAAAEQLKWAQSGQAGRQVVPLRPRRRRPPASS